MAAPEMDLTVKIGIAVFVLLLIGALVAWHAWFTPPAGRNDRDEHR